MPHPCAVCGRSRMHPNNRVEEYTFFGFPVNDEPRCKKWLEFCCREDLYNLPKKKLLQRMICSKHFVLSDFVNDFYDKLNSTAVPSIYEPKQSLYNIGCTLCERFRKDPPGPENDGVTFHHFPGEEFRCLKWLDFVGVESYYRLTRKEIMYCYICSKHFHKFQFMPGFYNRLIDSAVPNIKNPDESDEENEAKYMSGLQNNIELFSACNKDNKKISPLPNLVLESQACAACGRLRTDPKNKTQKYRFHPFPAYEIGRCLKWCQFLGREDILKMSPNQIRRLVLCSGHFQTCQNFKNGNGPCDAVPTIYECNNVSEIVSISENSTQPESEGNKITRASVSSKKPKIDRQNKPTPLAKKRGKQKRPTYINIPKIDPQNDSFPIKKLPIPTANNWKLIANQFHPIAISNNIINNVSSEIKNVILPFPGNISNLGDPIPVNSLSSIPPGLLIKINLPEQDKNLLQSVRKKVRRKDRNTKKVNATPYAEEVQNNFQNVNEQINIVEILPDNGISESLHYPEHLSEPLFDGDLEIHKHMNNIEEVSTGTMTIQNHLSFDEMEEVVVKEMQPKLRMSARCRRTLIPIHSELRRFLNKLKPHVKRLPKRAKAHVKLAIVNMVIDRL